METTALWFNHVKVRLAKKIIRASKRGRLQYIENVVYNVIYTKLQKTIPCVKLDKNFKVVFQKDHEKSEHSDIYCVLLRDNLVIVEIREVAANG